MQMSDIILDWRKFAFITIAFTYSKATPMNEGSSLKE